MLPTGTETASLDERLNKVAEKALSMDWPFAYHAVTEAISRLKDLPDRSAATPPSPDLIERLRYGWPQDEILSEDMPRVRKDALEAAAELSRLRAELDEANKISDMLISWAAAADGEPDLLVTEWQNEVRGRKCAETALASMRDRLEKYTDYSIDLQRIIEDLCHDRDIKLPETTARHHYDMAVARRAALASMREALAPLTEFAQYSEADADSDTIMIRVSFGQLRKAHAAIKKAPQ